jgi:dihydroorotate dehydrogenase electron transfer subunit
MIHSAVKEIRKEKGGIFTIEFDADMKASPGQFLMIWVPGLREIPMSLSRTEKPFSITFRVFGDSTRALSELRRGDYLFFRGPYGNSYPVPSGRIAYVAGGTGMASLKSMIDRYPGDVYVGAKNRDELFFVESGYYIATDDGSSGYRGTVVDLFFSEGKEYDYIFVCGPEQMMKSLYDRLPKNTSAKVFMSLERLMKCGIGICDSCSINGFRVCKDGTVFDLGQISTMTEFGISRRGASGKLEFLTNPKR